MILDKNLVFSDEQAIAGLAAAELASTNVYDSGAAGGTAPLTGTAFYGYAKDWGPGTVLQAEIRVTTSIVQTDADGSVKFAFQGSNTEGSGYVDLASVTIPDGDGTTMVAGYKVPMLIPASSLVYRYYRFATTPITKPVTGASAVTMFINLGTDSLWPSV